MTDTQLFNLSKMLHQIFQEERLTRFPDKGQEEQTELEAAILNVEFGCLGVVEELEQ